MTVLQKIEFILVTIVAILFVFLSLYLLIKFKKEKKRLQKRIEYLEKERVCDFLTGLSTRGVFVDEVEKILANGGDGTLLIFDINGLKKVNDTLGHPEGDNLIKLFAEKLSKAFKGYPVGRLGGDEFVVFLNGEHSEKVINEIIKKNNVNEFYFKPANRKLTSCCGIAESPKHGRSFEELYEKADRALYHSKKGSHTVTFCK